MLISKAKAELKDVKEVNNLIMDVNFNDEDKDCVRISIGDSESIIKYTDLFSFMFMLATKEQQALMMPVKEELGTQYMKQIRVKLKNDMKAGDEVVVNVPINVPEVIEGGNKSTGSLSPYSTGLTPGLV